MPTFSTALLRCLQAADDAATGAAVGSTTGAATGAADGANMDAADGAATGAADGAAMGAADGVADGTVVDSAAKGGNPAMANQEWRLHMPFAVTICLYRIVRQQQQLSLQLGCQTASCADLQPSIEQQALQCTPKRGLCLPLCQKHVLNRSKSCACDVSIPFMLNRSA